MAKTQHRYMSHFFTDFIQETSTTASDSALSETNSTGSAAQLANDDQTKVGTQRLATSNSASGRSALFTNTAIIRFGGATHFFECLVNFATLSVSAQRYQFLAGFFDTLTAAAQVDGAFLTYDEGGIGTGTAAAYWQTCTSSNSTRTFNTSLTQTTVNAAQWYRIGVEVNAAGTSVTFYVDGTAVSTHTANIPTGTGRQVGFGAFLIKSNGTTQRTADLDYCDFCCNFTTAR
jgi:hypothetical protein